MAATDARSHQDAKCKDEGRNKERVFSHGLANLLQNSFSLGASHAKDLLDFIVRIVAFLCLTCHVCRHTQSPRYPHETCMGSSLIYIAVTNATKLSLQFPLGRGISSLACVNTHSFWGHILIGQSCSSQAFTPQDLRGKEIITR